MMQKGKRWPIRNAPGRTNRRRLPFFLRLLVLVLAAFILLLAGERKVAPVVEVAVTQNAKELVMLEMTLAAKEAIAAAGVPDHQELMHIQRDEAGYVTFLAPDTMVVNELTACVIQALDAHFSELEHPEVRLPLGTFTGSDLLASVGPEMAVGYRLQATPDVQLMDTFDAAGINQTRHRIYLDIVCEVHVVVPFYEETSIVRTSIPVTEGIIVGYIPETYLAVPSQVLPYGAAP